MFVGLTTLDLVLGVAHAPAADEKVEAHSQELDVGGPAANAARTFAALGGRARLVTALGRHRVAVLIREQLTAEGVDVVDVTPEETAPPPVAAVLVGLTGERAIASRTPRSVRAAAPAVLAGADVVLFDGHLPAVAVPVARLAVADGVPVVVDAGRPRPVFDELLPLADVAILAEAWAGRELASLAHPGSRLLAVTAGGGPVRWWRPGGEGTIAPPRIEVRNTLGAGDVLHGSFCHALAAGVDPLDALRAGVGWASERCRADGLSGWLDALRAR